ncbi:hypothetical protein DUNSADRAFT_15061 [Dunaliella salina]|uniref:F-box domain-containing protein n=1 Tax=Dunaliella salina TaxID=3046 RepID=A0ABQ7G671_DUNSA|nr:hypothetical protein DUNSADRAFT_15061 [Dunaliella salina]|eukprot:KAF5830079.1 hypothetical protein DUNSADRAFT_15061 [Dunaliella salina]
MISVLPDEVVGLIFSLIPPEDPASRKAFYASCRTVRTCPCVLDQLQSMRLDLSNLPAYNPFLSFPRGSSLKSLHLVDTVHKYGRNTKLWKLLEPHAADEATKIRVRQNLNSVEELTLEHLYLERSAGEEAAARALCVLCPKLKRSMFGTDILRILATTLFAWVKGYLGCIS